MASFLAQRMLSSPLTKALLCSLLLIVTLSATAHAFPGCLSGGGSANQMTILSDLQMHDTSNYWGDLRLDEGRGLLFAAIDKQFWRIPVSLNLNASRVFICPDKSISLTPANQVQRYALDTARGLAYMATKTGSNMQFQVLNYTDDDMSLVGGPTDLQSSSTFYSIAYDPPTKSLWLSVGNRVYIYDLLNPTSPVFLQSLVIFQGFSPFEGGVVFDVAGRRGYYALTGQAYIEMNLDGQLMAGPYPFHPGNTGQLDYVSMAFDDVNKVFYMLGGMYSKTYVGASGFVARHKVDRSVSNEAYFEISANFRGLAIDSKKGVAYFTTNDRLNPVYAVATNMPLVSSSMTSMQLAQDSSGQTGTAYAGVFAASPNTDLAFFLHDATDGVANGVDVLSISTGGCGSASVPCLNADGTCSCLPSSLFSSVSPVSKCNDVSLNNQTVPFTLGYCIANPPPFIPSPPPQSTPPSPPNSGAPVPAPAPGPVANGPNGNGTDVGGTGGAGGPGGTGSPPKAGAAASANLPAVVVFLSSVAIAAASML